MFITHHISYLGQSKAMKDVTFIGQLTFLAGNKLWKLFSSYGIFFQVMETFSSYGNSYSHEIVNGLW